METSTALYLLSAIAQSLAAILAISATFVVFYYGRIKKTKKEIGNDLSKQTNKGTARHNGLGSTNTLIKNTKGLSEADKRNLEQEYSKLNNDYFELGEKIGKFTSKLKQTNESTHSFDSKDRRYFIIVSITIMLCFCTMYIIQFLNDVVLSVLIFVALSLTTLDLFLLYGFIKRKIGELDIEGGYNNLRLELWKFETDVDHYESISKSLLIDNLRKKGVNV